MIRHFVILFGVSYVACENLMLPKGSSCAWNGTVGRCVSVYKCLSAVQDIANKTFPPLCSYEDETAIICCTDCYLFEDTRLLVFNPQLGYLIKTGTSKAKDKCLDYIHSLEYPCKNDLSPISTRKKLDPFRNCTYEAIGNWRSKGAAGSGGHDALREEFPHMALLGFGNTTDTADWLCGGTVINERFILTAAHCLSNLRVGSVKYIALGILQRSDPSSLWQRYNVKRAIAHPGYKPPSKYHDIALLETDREISFSSQVLPACLHTDDQMDYYAQATGWGALGYKKSLADVLQSVLLRKFTEEQCSVHYPKHRHLVNGYDTSTQLCYGDVESQMVPTDTCEGDSGGPLQSRSHERCVYTILGVTSYGRPCGGAGGAGIYTRVKYYVPWIEDIVWP